MSVGRAGLGDWFVEIDGNTGMALDLAHPDLEALLADFLQELARKSLGEIRASRSTARSS